MSFCALFKSKMSVSMSIAKTATAAAGAGAESSIALVLDLADEEMACHLVAGEVLRMSTRSG